MQNTMLGYRIFRFRIFSVLRPVLRPIRMRYILSELTWFYRDLSGFIVIYHYLSELISTSSYLTFWYAFAVKMQNFCNETPFHMSIWGVNCILNARFRHFHGISKIQLAVREGTVPQCGIGCLRHRRGGGVFVCYCTFSADSCLILCIYTVILYHITYHVVFYTLNRLLHIVCDFIELYYFE